MFSVCYQSYLTVFCQSKLDRMLVTESSMVSAQPLEAIFATLAGVLPANTYVRGVGKKAEIRLDGAGQTARNKHHRISNYDNTHLKRMFPPSFHVFM